MLHATPLYFAIMAELERWRIALDIPMWKLSDGSGRASRYWAKALYPETPSGRQARWETLQDFVKVLFPDGFSLQIKPTKGGCMLKSKHRITIKFSGARYDHEARTDWMTELSKKGASKGGLARSAKLSPRRRKQIAKRAAKKRWSTPKIEEVKLG